MGCDIHSVAQVFKDGKWRTVLQDVGGDNRNYDTFAILANVRNGYGFAGVDTGNGYEPISEPKGFPEDFELREEGSEYHLIPKNTPSGNNYCWADEKYKKERIKEVSKQTEVWMGDHSHSYHTLEQIEGYLKKVVDKKTKKRGYIPEDYYLALRADNLHPNSWSGGISGPDIVTMNSDEYEYRENNKSLPKNKKIYVHYEWTVNYTDNTDLGEIVKQLQDLCIQYHVSSPDIRYVFGFDS